MCSTSWSVLHTSTAYSQLFTGWFSSIKLQSAKLNKADPWS